MTTFTDIPHLQTADRSPPSAGHRGQGATALRHDHAARFCTRCGEDPIGQSDRRAAVMPRVCPSCGMGVLLGCAAGAQPGGEFVVVADDLLLSAVSRLAEPLVGAQESVVGRDVREILQSPLGEKRLTAAIFGALGGLQPPVDMPGCGRSPAQLAKGMLALRIVPCGPPSAALVAMRPTAFGRS